MATAKELVKWAASQIGIKENPAGSNHIKYWDFYKDHCGKNYQGQPWCAAFVTCGMTKVGAWKFEKDEGRFRYCPSTVNWAKKKGQWLDRSKTPKAGDLVIFANKGVACHIGIVEKVLSSTKIQTIEGNTSIASNDNGGSVMRRTRTYGSVGSSWYILGFVRTKWDKNTPAKTVKKSLKSLVEVVRDVIDGKYGSGTYRHNKLKAEGYDPDVVQDEVNRTLAGKGSKKTAQQTDAVKKKTGMKTGAYKVTAKSGLNVRSRPSTKSPIVGGVGSGSHISVCEISAEGNSRVWGKISSGWVCLKEKSKMYVKKV